MSPWISSFLNQSKRQDYQNMSMFIMECFVGNANNAIFSSAKYGTAYRSVARKLIQIMCLPQIKTFSCSLDYFLFFIQCSYAKRN